MSKRDIETVCALAAHLAHQNWRRYPIEGGVPKHERLAATTAASDAMTLQRLGRRARRLIERGYARGPYGHHQRDKYEETQDIIGIGNALLKPYGLSCEVEEMPFDSRALLIVGLPCNGIHKNGRHEMGTLKGVDTLRDGFAI